MSKRKFQYLVEEIYGVDGDMGIYPSAVKGCDKEHDYEQRNGFKNGWNAAVMEYGGALRDAVKRATKGTSDDKSLLLAADVGWLRTGVFYLNMNDTWGWACAWAEEVPDDKIKDVTRLYRKWGCAGLDYWVSEQNEQMRSEFFDINRAVDFVRAEEKLIERMPNCSERAYYNPKKPWWKRMFKK